MPGEKTQRKLFFPPFELKAHHFSASFPNVTTHWTQYLEGHWKRQLTSNKKNYVLKRPTLYCVASYNHFHAYNVKANFYDKVYVHKLTAKLQFYSGAVLDRRASMSILVFLFQVARLQTSASLFCLSNFFFFLCFFFVSVWFFYRLFRDPPFFVMGFYFHHSRMCTW